MKAHVRWVTCVKWVVNVPWRGVGVVGYVCCIGEERNFFDWVKGLPTLGVSIGNKSPAPRSSETCSPHPYFSLPSALLAVVGAKRGQPPGPHLHNCALRQDHCLQRGVAGGVASAFVNDDAACAKPFAAVVPRDDDVLPAGI